MPSYYRSQLTATLFSDPSNSMSATHHWADLGDTVSEADAVTEINARLTAAYVAIDGFFPAGVGVPEVKIYDMADPEPRVPISTYSMTTFTPTGTSLLPVEVAVCCSFRGDYVSGINRGRLRGRTYLGPLSTSAITSPNGTTRPTVNTAFVTAISNWAQDMYDPISHPITWVVYSPTGSMYTAVEYWAVNNEFDTMRSRQPAPPLLAWNALT